MSVPTEVLDSCLKAAWWELKGEGCEAHSSGTSNGSHSYGNEGVKIRIFLFIVLKKKNSLKFYSCLESYISPLHLDLG